MYYLNRYTIEVSASPDSVANFMAECADVETPELSLALSLDAYKRTLRYGSSESWKPQDFQQMTINTNADVTAEFKPSPEASVEFSLHDGNRILRIISGSLALRGTLELPKEDPFAEQVLEGFQARIPHWFELHKRVREDCYKTTFGIFEAPAKPE